MAPIQRKISQVGAAKQTAKDSAATNPTYAFGLKSGRVVVVDLSQDRDSLTLASGRIANHGIRTLAVPGAEVSTRAWPKSIPLYLYGALGGISTSGAGPYTHTITPADDLPYLGVFGRLASHYTRIDNCKVDELTIAWDAAAPLDLSAVVRGTDLTVLGGAWTAATDDSSNDFFRAVGGTFKLDTASATAVTARVKAGSVRIANGIGPVQLADSVLADDVFPGEQVIDVSLTIIPDDLADWREALTGTAGGTTIAEVPTFGSFEVTFTQGAHSLKLASTRVMFVCEFPEGDPAGGNVELELVGQVVKPSGATAAMTATVVNDVATY